MKVKEVSSHFMQQSAHDRHQAHIVTDNFAHPSAHDKSLTSAITHHFTTRLATRRSSPLTITTSPRHTTARN